MPKNLHNSLLLKEPGLQVIRLSGTPSAMGQAHGRVLGADLKKMRREFFRYLARLSYGFGTLPLYLMACLMAWRFRPFLPTPLWEEIQAIAHGADMHISFILFINVMDDLLNNIPRCSAFAAPLGQDRESRFLLGRNLDYPLFAHEMCRFNTVFILLPDNGQPLVSIAWPGYTGICTGMNQSQVALGQLTASTSDFSLAGVPSALRNRLALQHHTSLVEVTARITSLTGTIGANLVLAAPDGALVLEVSAHHRTVRVPNHGVLTATNHYQSLAMQAQKGKAFRRPPLSPLDPYCFSPDYSLKRDQRLQSLLQNRNLTITEAQRILGDSVIANPCDINSVIFDTAASELYVAQSLNLPVSQQGRFRHFTNVFGPHLQIQ